MVNALIRCFGTWFFSYIPVPNQPQHWSSNLLDKQMLFAGTASEHKADHRGAGRGGIRWPGGADLEVQRQLLLWRGLHRHLWQRVGDQEACPHLWDPGQQLLLCGGTVARRYHGCLLTNNQTLEARTLELEGWPNSQNISNHRQMILPIECIVCHMLERHLLGVGVTVTCCLPAFFVTFHHGEPRPHCVAGRGPKNWSALRGVWGISAWAHDGPDRSTRWAEPPPSPKAIWNPHHEVTSK